MGEFYGLTIKDSTPELGRTDFNIGVITAGTLPGLLTAMGTLRTAIEGVILGEPVQSRWGDTDMITATTPIDPMCQRGIKWTVLMRDTTSGVPVINHIPTANLALLPVVGGKVVEDLDLTVNPGLALKTALEALVKSPSAGAVVVERIYYSD